MARIRIVDDWLRSPASPPTHWRSIMVVSEAWAEQRVLMRAYAESVDQTRPTIVLHGFELAIGPAGTDANGPWGIHVQPPVDGRAQELKEQLELASRRLAGSKGNPARLADEPASFERKRTNNWAPGTPRDLPGAPRQGYFEPSVAASQAMAAQSAQFVPQQPPAQFVPHQPPAEMVPAAGPPPRRRGWTSPMPVVPAADGARTALGYQSGAGAQNAVIRLGLKPAAASRLARIVDRTVPSDFQITGPERDVLNALGEVDRLSARQIAAIVGSPDAVTWMERLIVKLQTYGLDLIEPGPAVGGEPTYVLRR